MPCSSGGACRCVSVSMSAVFGLHNMERGCNRSFRGFPGTLAPCLFLKGGRVEGSSGFVPSEAHRGKDEECKEEGRESKP